ncbi:hypothetical protein ACROYT_G040909 [Oculina patagonica]
MKGHYFSALPLLLRFAAWAAWLNCITVASPDVDECANGRNDCHVNAICTNTFGLYNCTCKKWYIGDGRTCSAVAGSCKKLFDMNLSVGNSAYPLKLGSAIELPVYCHMTNDLGTCGRGGWTMVMKMDGNKGNFHYDSNLWSNNDTFNSVGGETGFDLQETKLPTYWNTSFSKICLANSLYSLIADGQYRATSLGRNTWKTLIGSQASLQNHCNKEGFNSVGNNPLHSKARIGYVSNQENECYSCDSRIGFGTGGYHDDTNTCGNEATNSPDNGEKHIKAMGYILIQ